MGKIVIILSILSLFVCANTETKIDKTIDETCLSCHRQQQIPNGLIYRRYLMQYSTDIRMEEAIFKYLKNPSKETSIMPPQFFLKFPIKDTLELDELKLHNSIKKYLKRFDIKEHLILGK